MRASLYGIRKLDDVLADLERRTTIPQAMQERDEQAEALRADFLASGMSAEEYINKLDIKGNDILSTVALRAGLLAFLKFHMPPQTGENQTTWADAHETIKRASEGRTGGKE